MHPLDRSRLAAIAWLGAVVATFAGQFAAQAAWDSPDKYSWAANDISDLGLATCREWGADDRFACSPHHALANVGFATYGVLIVVGVMVLLDWWRSTRWGSASALLLVITGVGSVIVGLAPADVHGGAHRLGAGLVFICGNLAMVCAAPHLRKSGAPVVAWLGVALGVAGLVSIPLFLGDAHLGLGRGGIERIVVWSLDAWNIAVAAWLLRRGARLPTNLGNGRT